MILKPLPQKESAFLHQNCDRFFASDVKTFKED